MESNPHLEDRLGVKKVSEEQVDQFHQYVETITVDFCNEHLEYSSGG